MVKLFLFFFSFGFIGTAQFNTVYNSNDAVTLQTIEKEVAIENATEEHGQQVNRMYSFVLPLDTIRINSYFGMRLHPIYGELKRHNGIDLWSENSNVYSVTSCIVKDVGYSNSFGSYIRLVSGDMEFVYAHLSHVYVTKGNFIKSGALIGRTGNTGASTKDHLHFEVLFKNKHLDPLAFIRDLLQIHELNP
ncbi:M23 family metallopeptidase [Flagellimonas flava]|uniref:M23 family metallopeptidase n=1 Tax=Flagellimonas flava TaxID=570519 RepID=UPI003D660E75